MTKKRVIVAAFLGMLSLGWTLNTLAADLFGEANAKYQAGDFRGAAAAYEELAASPRGASAAASYNLGSAYFRLGQKAKAMLWYLRAQRALPRDPDLEWNLDVLRSTLADRLEPAAPNLAAAALEKILGRVTIDEAALLFTASLLILAALAVAIYLLPSFRGVFGFSNALTAIFLLLSAALFYFKWHEVKDPDVVVMQKEVYARYGPSFKETKAFLLHEGADVKAADETKDWLYVRLPDSTGGWIPKSSCERV